MSMTSVKNEEEKQHYELIDQTTTPNPNLKGTRKTKTKQNKNTKV